MAVDLVCVPLIAVCFPETKGRGLEEMDGLFGGSLVEGRGLVEGDAGKAGVVESGKEVGLDGRKA